MEQRVPSGENATDLIKKWKTRDSKAQYYIVMTIDKHITPHIINCKTSKEMFDTLKGIYERDSEYQKCRSLKPFYSFQFSTQKDVIIKLLFQNAPNIKYF
jgi:hypothetical protein